MSEYKQQYKLIPDQDGFEPGVVVSFRQEPMDREQLAELLGINLIDPNGTTSKLTDELIEYLNEAVHLDMNQVMKHAGKHESTAFSPQELKDALPATTIISDKRVMTLFWCWTIETSFDYQKLQWRDDLTPEEQGLVEKWDAIREKSNHCPRTPVSETPEYQQGETK